MESAAGSRAPGRIGDRRGDFLPNGAPHAQKNDLKPHLQRQWVIPPEQSGDFVWHMEDVLEVYTRPHDPHRPVICMDEVSRQVLCEVRDPLPLRPGQVRREDYEYARGGVLNLFLFCEPLAGWRHLTVTDQRTKADWAAQIQQLVDVHYPDAERIVLVMDNLNTHTPAALYEYFGAPEARRLVTKLEIHYTPNTVVG